MLMVHVVADHGHAHEDSQQQERDKTLPHNTRPKCSDGSHVQSEG